MRNLIVNKNAKGEVFLISYIGENGKKISFSGSENIPEYPEYSKSGQRFFLAPLKASKPEGEKAYIRLIEDGGVQVFADQAERSYAPTKGPSSASLNRIYLRYNGGAWLDANNKKDFNKKIASIFTRCPAFLMNHSSSIKNDVASLKKASSVYNDNCRPLSESFVARSILFLPSISFLI